MPLNSIDQIRSVYFTTDLPKRAKFKLNDAVCFNFDTGIDDNVDYNIVEGTIVGMQRITGKNSRASKYSQQHGSNRYYIQDEQGLIHVRDSMYVWKKDPIRKGAYLSEHVDCEETPLYDDSKRIGKVYACVNVDSIHITINGIKYRLTEAS